MPTIRQEHDVVACMLVFIFCELHYAPIDQLSCCTTHLCDSNGVFVIWAGITTSGRLEVIRCAGTERNTADRGSISCICHRNGFTAPALDGKTHAVTGNICKSLVLAELRSLHN